MHVAAGGYCVYGEKSQPALLEKHVRVGDYCRMRLSGLHILKMHT
jgi:hypothetical protein